MTWDSVGSESGIYHFPQKDDLLLVGFVGEDVDYPVILKRFSSESDKIPPNALGGDMVLKTREGENLWITGQRRVNITRGDAQPGENLVLGQVFKKLCQDLLEILKKETHICMPPGYESLPPSQASEYDQLKQSPVDDEKSLSDVAFTEKGE